LFAAAMCILILALIALCSAQTYCPNAPSSPQDRRTNRTKIRLATFNAEWLFPGNDGKSPWNTTGAEKHLTDVAAAVAGLGADIIFFQEVYDCSMMERLNAKLVASNVNGYKPYVLRGTDTATGQNCALLTRVDPFTNLQRTEDRVAYPISGNKCNYTGSSGTSAVSKHFWARFNISGVTYTFTNHHFLAYPTTPDRCVQREAQASVMRSLINQAISRNDEIVVAGDYNDYSDAVPDAVNDVPTSRVMRILRQGLVNAEDEYIKSYVDPTLYEVSNRVTKNNRYTNAYNANNISMIDHLLVTTGIANRITAANVALSLYARQTTSDHWPFYVDFST
jgi:exonuclease III